MQERGAEIDPIPIGQGGGTPEPEIDKLTQILNSFNETFGNIKWQDSDLVREKIAKIPEMVSKNERYQNAIKKSDKQNARIESEQALEKVMFGVMSDDMEL